MSEPLVSIVIPTYNRVRLLGQALASVRAQSFTDWECIVVDDGSADGTAELLARTADARVRVISRSHCGHPGAVRNVGLAESRGRFVAFLDDDDLWEPEKLALQLPLHAAGVRWSYTGFVSIGPTGQERWRTTPDRIRTGDILGPLLALRAAVALPTVLVARELLVEIGGFDETFWIHEDYALWLRLAARAEVGATAEHLAIVRDHPGRIFRPEAYRFKVRLYRQWHDRVRDPDLRRICRRRLVDTHLGEANRRLAQRRIAATAGAIMAAIGADPVRAGRRLAAAAVRRWGGTAWPGAGH